MTPLFAMHMANELLSVPVAAVTLAVAAAAVAMAARRARRAAADDRLPLMGVMGAFVFAAQMINFTLPGMPGTSGHLGGGVLLAILLGPGGRHRHHGRDPHRPVPAVPGRRAAGPGLQHHQHGRGSLPARLGALPRRARPGGQGGGVAAVPGRVDRLRGRRHRRRGDGAVEAAASGVLQVPLSQFLGVMIGVHLVIGLCEGAVTFAVIAYLRRVRPELMGLEPADAPVAARRPGYGVVTASLLVTALLLAGVVSWFASTWPDGLEWSYLEHRYGAAEQSRAQRFADRCRGRPVAEPMVADDRLHPPRSAAGPVARRRDGRVRVAAWPNPDGWRSLAGVLGTIVTLSILYGVSRWMRRTPR